MKIEDYLESKETELQGIVEKLEGKLDSDELFNISSEEQEKFNKLISKMNDLINNL